MRFKNFPALLLFAVLLVGLTSTLHVQPVLAAGPHCYVNAAATGSNTGADWTNAFTSLQSALTDSGCTEIWVAQGVYKPSTTGVRTHTFTINRNLTLYGGFPSSGNPTLPDRDPTLYPTILSGDLGGDDTTDTDGVVLDWENIIGSDNSYHVLTMASPGAAVLDGFVVTAGYADSTASNKSAGGLYSNGGGGYTLRNMIFRGNRSYSGGGAGLLVNNSGTVTVQDSRFIGNGGLQGGAISIGNTTTNLTRVLFQENDAVVTGGGAARIGGAIVSSGSSNYDSTHPLTLTDVQFISNTAAGSNSAIYQGYGTAILTNVLFQGNNDLGSWPNAFGSDLSALTLTNVVFAGNRGNGLRAQICYTTLTNVTASGNGNYGISLSNGTLAARNSVIYGNTNGGFSLSGITPTIRYSLVQGGCPGGATCTNVLSVNPLFVTPITAPAPTTTGNLHLQSFSPAIDAGDNTVTTPALPATDFDGRARQLDDPATVDTGSGSAPIVDMGAYEFAGPTLVSEIRQASDDAVITTAPIDTFIYGQATIYGIASIGTPTGTATLYIYDNATCTGAPVAVDDPQTLVDGIAQSNDFAARSVYYQIAYSGDINYAPMTSNCTLFSAYQPGPTFTVNTTADNNLDDGVCSDVHCTLRDAINAAVNTAGDNTILFDVGDNQTLTLDSVLPNLSAATGSITIDGETHAPTISGNNLYRVFKVNSGAQVTLARLTLAGGRDSSSECDTHSCGGGLKVEAGATVTLSHSMVLNNRAYYGGGIFSSGTLQIRNSTIANNVADSWDGGIYSNGNLMIENSTISGNTATSGNVGGLASVGSLTMTNSSIVGNTAAGDTGGLRQQSSAASLYNTLIANNSGLDCSLTDGATLAANIHNFIEDGTCSPYLSGAPALSPLADNGGETQTHALQATSPAIDAGDPATCTATDQRGQPRDDLGCDIGAFEARLSDLTTVSKIVSGAGTYTFGPTLAKIEVVNTGSCLTGLQVQRVAGNHPNATANLQTGAYWVITPTGCTSGFNVTLTLPAATPDENDKLCRYTGVGTVWDCAASGFNANTITRANVTAFSDWTVGDDSGPTAVTLTRFAANRAPFGSALWLIVLLLLPLFFWAIRKKVIRM